MHEEDEIDHAFNVLAGVRKLCDEDYCWRCGKKTNRNSGTCVVCGSNMLVVQKSDLKKLDER